MKFRPCPAGAVVRRHLAIILLHQRADRLRGAALAVSTSIGSSVSDPAAVRLHISPALACGRPHGPAHRRPHPSTRAGDGRICPPPLCRSRAASSVGQPLQGFRGRRVRANRARAHRPRPGSSSGVRHRPTHFAHVFSGRRLCCGYYSDMWSEVLDVRRVSRPRGAQSIFHRDPPSGCTITRSCGGGSCATRPALYESFRGRLPTPDALLPGACLTPDVQRALFCETLKLRRPSYLPGHRAAGRGRRSPRSVGYSRPRDPVQRAATRSRRWSPLAARDRGWSIRT